MVKQFVTYEIALKLKELGFDEKCIGVFSLSKTLYTPKTDFDEIDELHFIKAPLWQQALKWLRDKHHINIVVNFELHMKWWFSVDKAPYTEDDDLIWYLAKGFDGFETYEAALEAGLREALNLIII